MRVLVCGGRDYVNTSKIYETLDDIDGITSIIHGGARGADSIAGQYAKDRDLIEEVFQANWDLHGRQAGFMRNAEMAETAPDLVVAFQGGAGTRNMINIAKWKKITVIEIKG